jgi:hypothetical protein
LEHEGISHAHLDSRRVCGGTATAVAYARTDVVVGVAAIGSRRAADEPIALLLSGSTLLVVATALRRRLM